MPRDLLRPSWGRLAAAYTASDARRCPYVATDANGRPTAPITLLAGTTLATPRVPTRIEEAADYAFRPLQILFDQQNLGGPLNGAGFRL